MDTKQQLDYYTGRVREMLRRVPDKVNGGSHDTVVTYKKLVAQANKVLGSNRPKLDTLIQVHNQLAVYY